MSPFGETMRCVAPMLTDMPTGRLDALIKHPFHRENGERLVGFIKDLRECHSAEDLVTFQRELLTATLAVNLARAERSRVIKRLRKRESLPVDAPELVTGDPYDLDDWRLEYDVLERVGRQLRSIGDAMAWRAFRYDRRYILALRRNESPGPMTLSKEGTAHVEVVGPARLLWVTESASRRSRSRSKCASKLDLLITISARGLDCIKCVLLRLGVHATRAGAICVS